MTAYNNKIFKNVDGGHAMMSTYEILTILIMFGGFLIALIDFIRKIIMERKRKDKKVEIKK